MTTVGTKPHDTALSDSDTAVADKETPQTVSRWRERLRRIAPDLLAAAIYLALGIWVTGRLWAGVGTDLSGHNPTDHVWFEWLLSHAAYSVTHLENPFFSMRQNVPDGVNMMANTSILGAAIPLTPITLLFGPEISYLVLLVGGLAGTAFACYYVFSRHLVTSRLAAGIGAGFCGFAPGFVHHANGQPNFVLHFLVPFIVLGVLRLAQPHRAWRNGVILGLLIAYQAFLNQEMLLLTALACLVMVVAYALCRPRTAWHMARNFATGLGVTALVAGALLAYPIWMEFRGPRSYQDLPSHFGSWGEDVAAYVSFARDTLAGPGVERRIAFTEQNTWFGWPLVVVAVICAVALWRRSITARVATITALVFAVLALGPSVRFNSDVTDIPGPWRLVSNLPVFELVLPTRLTFVVIGAIGILIALAIDRLIARAKSFTTVRPRVWRWAGIAVIVGALLPLLPTPLPAAAHPAVPRFITDDVWQEYVPTGRTLVSVPLPSNTDGLPGLRWSAVALQEFAIPMGYFLGPDAAGRGHYGPLPRPTSLLLSQIAATGQVPPITPQLQQQTRVDLQRWRAGLIVLSLQLNETVLRDTITALLQQPPQRVADVWIWPVSF